MSIVLLIIKIFGSLGLFLFGMKELSEGLQKASGGKLKKVLDMMTGNSLKAVLTGVLITIIIQSSSATTVMVVSFVNSGLLSLVPAIGVIIGANIGTTVTGWIVALLGFKLDITTIALIAIAFSLPLMFSKKNRSKDISSILLGFGLLFLGLEFLQSSMPDISGNISLLSFLSRFNSGTLPMTMLCVLIGILLTVIVQSSSASMAITLTLAFQGWIGVNAACALVLGQNIGTTVTAFIASLGASVNAKRSSWAHIIFNIVGTIIAIIFFKPFLRFVNFITPGDIYSMSGEELRETLPVFLAMFHTSFNIVNAVLFFPFIKKFSHLIELIIPEKEKEDGRYHFKRIGNTLLDASEVYSVALKGEVKKMSELCIEMFYTYKRILFEKNVDIEKEVEKVKRMENYADDMQEELSDVCVTILNDSRVSFDADETRSLLRTIDELESITDSCCNLVILEKRRADNAWSFSHIVEEKLSSYVNLVDSFLVFIEENINNKFSYVEEEVAKSFEERIDEVRNTFYKETQERLIYNKDDVKIELLVLEEIRHLEHIGDYCMNIAETMKDEK